MYDFRIGEEDFQYGYFLADGIYPNWPIFVKPFSEPLGDGQKIYNTLQEARRKDIERCFGVNQMRFKIFRDPLLLMYLEDIDNTVTSCFILHNMII